MKFASNTTRFDNPDSDGSIAPVQAQKRECKLLLASLLFTGSLVAFVITSLPQILSLPALSNDQRFANAAQQTAPAKTLSITVNPPPEAETVHLSVSSNSSSEVQHSVKINDQTVAIALPASTTDRYTINVTVQPASSAATALPRANP